MLNHENVWSAIDRLAAAFGYSPSGLARRAGLDPTAFNKSKRFNSEGKPRWPSTESVSLILAATGASMADFLSLMDAEGDIVRGAPMRKAGVIPVIGFAQAGSDGFFDEDGYPVGEGWDEVRFPDGDRSDLAGAYALEISGDSMEPLYRAGDVLIVSPTARVRKGDRVVVRSENGEVMAKELLRKTASRIELKSFNPAHEDRIFAAGDVTWIARIMWVSQ